MTQSFVPPRNLPQLKNLDNKVCTYHVEAHDKGGSLHVNRHLMMNFLLLEPKYYGALRNFYEQARRGDEEQVILSSGAASTQN